MIDDFDFQVCVLARHPEADMSELAVRMGKPPKHVSSKGTPIVTLTGNRPGGTYSESRCLVEMGSSEDGTLADCVSAAIKVLEANRDFVDSVKSTGGDVELFAFWYPNGDTSASFSPELLVRLGAVGVTLGFNVYGVQP